MRRIISALIAIVLVLGIIVGFSFWVDKKVAATALVLKDYKSNEILNNKACIQKQLDEKTMLVLGSSELDDVEKLGTASYPLTLFNKNNSDFQVLLLGRGNTQSLSHAINIAALSDSIPNKKVVLLISPQWFTPEGISSEAFASRFYAQMYAEGIANRALSTELKQRLSSRTKALLDADPSAKKQVELYSKIYVEGAVDPINFINLAIGKSFMTLKNNYSLVKEAASYKPAASDTQLNASSINFNDLLNEAETYGKQNCTNNDFGIYNDYFDEYIAKNLDSFKGSMSKGDYSTSPEYSDLQLFIDVCKETGIEPMLVSVPVNGRWYDYCGFSAEKREAYYKNIREIAKNNDVSLADFSGDEDTLYFLRDIMHLGWKGWAKIDEKMYEFYKQN